MKLHIFFLFFTVIFLPLYSNADVAPNDFLHQSIYQIDPATDGILIGASAALNISAEAYANRIIVPHCPCDPGEVNTFDRGVIGNNDGLAGRISDVTVGTAILAPMIIDYIDVGASREFFEDMVVYAETVGLNGAFVTTSKYITQRPLPSVYAGQSPELYNSPGGYRSFYSGHTSVTFSSLTAGAMTWTLRHGPSIWPWVIVGTVGTSVAAERVMAGRHFYSDVIVGAFAGALTGYFVPKFHTRKDAWNRFRFGAVPMDDGVELLAGFSY